MKIAVCGTQCIGKTTFINDFIKEWPMYIKSPKNYRNIIKQKGLTINREGTEESQELILNALVDEIVENKVEHIIFDRCVLDNLIYTLWLNSKGKVSDAFVKKSITIVRETLVLFDLIFFVPITKYSPVNIESAENRDIDPVYRNEIDILFKSLMSAYTKQSNIYFPIQHDLGCPAIIEIFGNPSERIQLTKMYINPDGTPFKESESLITPEEETDLAREAYGLS